KRNAIPAPVWTEEVLVDGAHMPLSGGALTVPTGSHRLEIHYTALSYLAPKKVAFRYRLKGFSDEWVEAQNGRVAVYTNVPPGRYTFEVMGSNDDGVWSAVRNPLRIEMDAALYQMRWFWIAVAAMALIALRVGFKMRLRWLVKREELLEQRV